MRKLYTNFSIKQTKKGAAKVTRHTKAHRFPSLNEFLCNLFMWHGDDSLLKMLELRSLDNCEEQDEHQDSPEMERDRTAKKWTRDWTDIEYSILISVWPGTVWVNEIGEIVEIPVGSFVIWRGDYRHRGGAYSTEHHRLFICLGSERYPPSDYVAVETKEEMPSGAFPTVASDRYPLRGRFK
jgi:hypothetical protein